MFYYTAILFLLDYMNREDIKKKVVEHFKSIKQSNPEGVSDLWIKDYEETTEQSRFFNNVAYTIYGIFFSAVVITLGIMLEGFETTTPVMIYITSALSLVLIWASAIIFNRMTLGANINNIYAKSMEEVLFNGEINNRNFSHRLSNEVLKNRYIPDVGYILSVVVAFFSGFALWLSYAKFFTNSNWFTGSSNLKNVAYWGAIPLFVFVSWVIYYFWLDKTSRRLK